MSSTPSLYQLEQHDDFIHRHIGPDQQQAKEMLESLGLTNSERAYRVNLTRINSTD